MKVVAALVVRIERYQPWSLGPVIPDPWSACPTCVPRRSMEHSRNPGTRYRPDGPRVAPAAATEVKHHVNRHWRLMERHRHSTRASRWSNRQTQAPRISSVVSASQLSTGGVLEHPPIGECVETSAAAELLGAGPRPGIWWFRFDSGGGRVGDKGALRNCFLTPFSAFGARIQEPHIDTATSQSSLRRRPISHQQAPP